MTVSATYFYSVFWGLCSKQETIQRVTSKNLLYISQPQFAFCKFSHLNIEGTWAIQGPHGLWKCSRYCEAQAVWFAYSLAADGSAGVGEMIRKTQRYQVVDIKYQNQSIRPKWEKREAEEVRIILGSGCSCQRAPHYYAVTCCWGFPGGSDGKESACSAGDSGSISELGRSPGEGNGYPLQYSWNSTDRGAWWATVPGVTESGMTEWLTTTTTACWHGRLSWQEADQLAESTGWACTVPH